MGEKILFIRFNRCLRLLVLLPSACFLHVLPLTLFRGTLFLCPSPFLVSVLLSQNSPVIFLRAEGLSGSFTHHKNNVNYSPVIL